MGSFLIFIRSHVINKLMYGYMLPNLSPSPNLYRVQNVYNGNVASVILTWGTKVIMCPVVCLRGLAMHSISTTLQNYCKGINNIVYLLGRVI